MAFTAKILSWRFRHLNIVGCLLKRRPTKGGSRTPQDPPPPSYAPELVQNSNDKQKKTIELVLDFKCVVLYFLFHGVGKITL